MLTVVPVAVAVMTPIPLLLMYIYQKCSAGWTKKKGELLGPQNDDKMTSAASTSVTEPYTTGTGNVK
jgi:hypothetical protein